MIIRLDQCYKINFKTTDDGAGANFSLLDGFYEVVRSYGWNELNGAKIDLQANLLAHTGITDGTALTTLQQNWTNDIFYYCIGMDQDRQIWVPESIIKGYPDPRIASYKKLGLVVDLGLFADKDDFSTLSTELMNYLKSNYGIDDADASVTVYGNEWKTIAEFNETNIKRKSLQGLVFTTQHNAISPSSSLTDQKIVFEQPVVLSKKNENIIPGAISDSIGITYGLELTKLPRGTVDSETQCWYYKEEDILSNNTELEQLLNINFNAVILSAIYIKTKFARPSYAWTSASLNTIYTTTRDPMVDSIVYADKTTVNERGIVTSVESDTLVVDGISYEFNVPANAIMLDITYRCRNTKVKYDSPYSAAIRYAYENINLRQRIAALEEIIENQVSE